MKWQEVRELFPDQIRTVSEQDANKEFFQVEPGNVVYHTSNPDFVIHLRKDPLMRVRH